MSMEIAVLGCGPAGCITAIGLAKLGYKVSLIGTLRKIDVYEGISNRVYHALANVPAVHALKAISEPLPRTAFWNGEKRVVNTERVISRLAFDAALLKDVNQFNIPVYNAHIKNVCLQDGKWIIHVQQSDKLIKKRFAYLVEARGRSAKLTGYENLRGVKTISLGMNFQAGQSECCTIAASLPEGWLWLANGNKMYAQITMTAVNASITDKKYIEHLLIDSLRSSPAVPKSLSLNPISCSEAIARNSTAILVKNPVNFHVLRVGDAALAADPLSGSGIFLSLSSALVAPAVINTILKRPDDAYIAMQFYISRINHLFYRFARIGRDFYRMEKGWEDRLFWSERSIWPDNEPVHVIKDTILGEEVRPVLNGNFIEHKNVVITSEHPLGIWKIDDQDASHYFSRQLRCL